MNRIKFANLEVTNVHLIDTVTRVLRSGEFVRGQTVLDFEEKWAKACNAKYCVATSSGTMALFSMMKTLRIIGGIGEKERPLVILPGLSYAATLHAIREAGFDPVYCDVTENGLIDMELCENISKTHYDDIYFMPVHLYGQLVNLSHSFLKHATIVEDAAQAHGVFRKVEGDAACFSFYPSKNLGGIGDGGAIVTDDEAIYTAARLYGNIGDSFTGKYEHSLPGLNLRMDAIQAAFLQAKLELSLLDKELKARKRQVNIYKGYGIETLATAQPNGYHLYPILVNDPASAIKLFNDKNIAIGRHYPYTLPGIGKDKKHLPNSEIIAKHNITLPLGSHLTRSQIAKVCTNLLRYFRLDGRIWKQKL